MSASWDLGREVLLCPGGSPLLSEDTLPKHPGEHGQDRAPASGSGVGERGDQVLPWER